ncbi:hypothetical protein N5T96_06785 [Aliarcobacter butzleri]|uniref:hypothetical protein n=1 Tax=Aliarcobacter butzleri TaxID=28197 RepID=UPI0021B2EBA7|nr:hypothetical protein [Aliarcobacter butzleri]MCT7566043.1 hypothetical protein [Aliarcobacter butzleri]MCT7573393.1 hypothetical protein [Aliarcobacter butzleri]
MEKNDEITLSEAKKITGELKASILKLEVLNSGVIANMQELEKLNIKMEDYISVVKKFNFKNEEEMTHNYSIYLAFLSKKIDELSKNSNLKRIEFLIENSNKITNFATLKFALIVAIGVISVLLVPFLQGR